MKYPKRCALNVNVDLPHLAFSSLRSSCSFVLVYLQDLCSLQLLCHLTCAVCVCVCTQQSHRECMTLFSHMNHRHSCSVSRVSHLVYSRSERERNVSGYTVLSCLYVDMQFWHIRGFWLKLLSLLVCIQLESLGMQICFLYHH